VSRTELTEPTGSTAAEPTNEAAQWVYGVVPAGFEVPEGLTGIDEVPVETISEGDLAALVSVIDLDRPPGRRADLFAHAAVVDAAAYAGPVVPVQFGSVLADRIAVVEDFLTPNGERFDELLTVIEGRSQYNLRASYQEDVVLAEVVAEDPEVAELRAWTRDLPEGAAYGDRVRLGELVARAMEAKRDADGQFILEAVVPLVAAHTVRSGSGLNHLLDLALLIEDDRRDDVESALESVAETMHQRARLQLYGPLAPYDFVKG
jgi:gas vesicle protein GvpL/GvpF